MRLQKSHIQRHLLVTTITKSVSNFVSRLNSIRDRVKISFLNILQVGFN